MELTMTEIQQKKKNQINLLIESAYPLRNSDPEEKRLFILAAAMMNEYVGRYASGDFKTIATELEFVYPIRNPATGRESKSFIMRGKIDRVIQLLSGEYGIFEHKTASRVDGAYIDRLALDTQIAIYAHFGSMYLAGEPLINKIIYNILCKIKQKQSPGETEEEYQIRYADLCAKNKSGKSSAKQKLPETDAEYYQRIFNIYHLPATPEDDKLQRLELIIDKYQTEELLKEIWDITQQILLCQRTGAWYKNPDHCFVFNSRCEFYSLCLARIPDALIETDYEQSDNSHRELSEVENDKYGGKKTLTYSAIKSFRNCRRHYYWRYVRGLSAHTERPAMYFGKLIHDCLEIWHSIENQIIDTDEGETWQ
jgi:hypothetical protein